MTTRALMILVAEAAALSALTVFMDKLSGGYDIWCRIGLFATWIVGLAAYAVRLAERSSSWSGAATLGRVMAGVAVYLGRSLVIPPPLVPLIAGAVVAVAMVREGDKGGWVPISILIASGGLVYLAWLIRAVGLPLLDALGWSVK
jgi:hypothetical protein